MDKIKELGWQKIMIITAVLEIVCGVIVGIAFGATVAGVVMGVVCAGVSSFVIYILCGKSIAGYPSSDKYK